MEAQTLSRPRLVDRSGLPGSQRPRFVLVLGMPGSGKSVLLDALLAATPLPVGRVALRRRSSDDPAVLAPALQQLGLTSPSGVESLDQIASPAILAIDNLDRVLDGNGVPTAAAQVWLNAILANPQLTLVATSQVFPDLPAMARLATRGLLTLIGAAELAFSPAECAALWAIHQPAPLAEPDLAALYAAAGGWAAPVVLGCRQRWPLDPSLLSMLVDDVLAQLAPLQLQRLSSVALLDTLSEPAVACLSGVDHGARLISEWQHLGYVQASPQCTLQPLLKVALQRALRAEPAAYQAAILATATWLAAQDDGAALVRLARKTQSWPVLMQLLGQQSAALLRGARHAEVIDWLENVPAAALSAEVGSLLVRCHAAIGDRDRALALLTQLLGQLPSAHDQCTVRLLTASVSLDAPDLDDPALAAADRAHMLHSHGMARAAAGEVESGLDYLGRAAALLEEQGVSRLAGLVLVDYARVAVEAGRYPLAARLLRQAEQVWRDLSPPVPPELASTLKLQALVALHTGPTEDAPLAAAGRRAASADPCAPVLTLRVHGQATVAWHGHTVKLPRHGVELLTMLLLSAGSGMTADELRDRLWGSDGGSADGWRKLLQRVRKLLAPEAIILEGAIYRLDLPPEAIDADVLLVRQWSAGASDLVRLRAAAAYAARPLLPGNDAAWVVGERKAASLRGAELWYAVGNLEGAAGQGDAAAAAYATALQLNPLAERAVVAGMTLALEHGQRCAAIGIYQAYAQQMLDEMGLDPCPTIDALYRRALEP